MKKSKLGFTFLEVIVTVSLLFTILTFVTLSLLNTRNKASLNSSLDLMISDIQTQQLKAMSANTEGRSTVDNYGILIENSGYRLFHGTYSAQEASNVVISLEYPLQLSTTFSTSQVIFTKKTGAISGFVPNQNTITITDTSQNRHKTIQFNSLGVITSVD